MAKLLHAGPIWNMPSLGQYKHLWMRYPILQITQGLFKVTGRNGTGSFQVPVIYLVIL